MKIVLAVGGYVQVTEMRALLETIIKSAGQKKITEKRRAQDISITTAHLSHLESAPSAYDDNESSSWLIDDKATSYDDNS